MPAITIDIGNLDKEKIPAEKFIVFINEMEREHILRSG